MEKSVEAELNLLEMGGTRFEVRFIQEDSVKPDSSDMLIKSIRSDGYDRVEFMLSPNIGEDLRPLSRIASGGELSRIMLALKTILARKTSLETIILIRWSMMIALVVVLMVLESIVLISIRELNPLFHTSLPDCF